jgi:hypothetical protein
MNIAHKSTFVLGGRHLLGIDGLSYSDIVGLLDLAEEFFELNRQKKSASCHPSSFLQRSSRRIGYLLLAVTRTNHWTHALESQRVSQ